MTHRLLEPDEWPRLDGTSLGALWPAFEPSRTAILVVEDEAGQILGCWAFLWVLHAEGIWIAPEHRGRSGVARHLLRGLREVGASADVRAIWTGAEDEPVAALLEHLGAEPIRYTSYALPLVKGES